MKLNPPKPKARFKDLVVQDLADEILIYDLENNKAYSLNKTTTLVWQNCDGTKDITQIAKVLEKQLNQTVTDDLVWLALDSLKNEDLITFNEDPTSYFKDISRREVIKRIGVASLIALPIITSIIAPTSAHAQSGIDASCLTCLMSLTVGECGPCNTAVGSCYSNNGCGAGQFLGNSTCSACAANPSGDSWQFS